MTINGLKFGNILELISKSIPVLLGIFIFLNPFPHNTGTREIVYTLTVFFVILLLCTKKYKFSFSSPLAIPFLLLTGWVIITHIFALDPKDSIRDSYSHLIKYIVIYFILINCIATEKHFLIFINIIIVSVTLFAVAALIYFYFIEGHLLTERFGISFKNSATNIIGFSTISAFLFSLSFFFSAGHIRKKLLYFSTMVPLFAASFLTQSRADIVALVVSISVILAIKSKKIMALILMLLIAISILSPLSDRFLEKKRYKVRSGLLLYSLEIIKANPLWGTGFSIDTFQNHKLIKAKQYLEKIPEEYRRHGKAFNFPHSIFLSIAIRSGLPALLLYLLILITAAVLCLRLQKYGRNSFIRQWSNTLLAALMMFIIKGAVEPAFTHLVDTIFYTILAMITILWRLNTIGSDPEYIKQQITESASGSNM
ncbi:MAG: O-antigen ligase family protein [Desulfobacterales bacterium]|nr:O-antigen ligase family protein [Desulfobacterales bacterium]